MHRTKTRAAAPAAAFAAILAAAGGALAAPSPGWPGIPGRAPAAERAQYHSDWRGPRDVDEHRWLHRQRLRAYEEERVAEAARREARRVEKMERAERRAWRAARREWHPRGHDGF